MVDETNVDDFLEELIESTLKRAIKGIYKSGIKRVAKKGLRKKPVQYPAGWKGPVGSGGQFARKEDIARAKATTPTQKRAEQIRKELKGKKATSPARSKGGARGSKAADIDKTARSTAAVRRAVRGEQGDSEAKKDLDSAAKDMSSRTDRPGDTKRQKAPDKSGGTKAENQAKKAGKAQIRGFRSTKAWMDRKLSTASGEESMIVKNMLKGVLENISSEYADSLDQNKIMSSFKNQTNALKQRIEKMDADGKTKERLKSELKEMINAARTELMKDLKDRKESTDIAPKGAQGAATKRGRGGRKVKVTKDAGTQVKTRVGDKKFPVEQEGPKRKRFAGPRPVGVKETPEGTVVDSEGKMQRPNKATAQKIRDVRARDEARKTGASAGKTKPSGPGRKKGELPSDAAERKKIAAQAKGPKKKRTGKKRSKVKEALIREVLDQFPNFDNV